MAIYKEKYVLNGEVTGELLYSKDAPGWVSGFSSQNTWRVEKLFSPTADQSFEVSVRVRTGSSISSPSIQEIFAISKPLLMRIDAKKIALSYNTGSWRVVGSYSCSTNTEYLTVFKYHPEATTTNGYTYSAKYLYFEIYNSSGDLLHRSSASLNNTFLNFVGEFAYLGSQDGAENWSGSIHNGEDTYIKVNGEIWWQPLKEEQIDVSGSVEISKGYYSDGSNKIIMPASTYNIDALTANQTLGGKNKLFAYTDSTDSVGALITSTTPTGSFKITKDIEHPVYLDPTKNYIAGGELIEPSLSFTSGTAEIWVQPTLTSATSYGTCTDSRNNTGESQEGWRALDGQSGTDFSPAREGGWWKWVVPDTLTFRAGTSTIVVTSGSPATPMNIQFFADEAATKPLTGVVSLPGTVGANTTIPITNTEVTSTIYMTIAAHSNWSEISEISFVNVFKGVVEASVSYTKALQYSEAQDTAYWIPSETTVSLDSVKAVQSVGPVNDLYLTTTTGTPTASLSFSDDSEIAGVTTKLPLKQKVYLNNETDVILGVQERPDELVITGGVTHNYKMVGPVAWLTGWIAEGFSSTQYLVPYLNIPQPTGTDVLEIFTRVKVPSSYSGNKALFNRTDKDRGLYVQYSSKKFGFYDGTSRLSIAATAGQTYWVGYTQDANKACKFAAMLDDGTYSSVDELPSLSDSAWGTPITWTSSEFTMVGDNVFYLGYNKVTGVNWGDGWIYLQDTVARVVSSEGTPTSLNWRATTVQNGVTLSGWSALYSDVTGFTGNTALDYTTPVSVDASSLEIPSGVETADLWYVNGDIKCKLPTDPVLDKAVFTGYSLVLDSGVISRAEKTGGLCAAFVQRGSSLSSRGYLLIASESLNEGTSTVLVGIGNYNMSAQGTLPPVEVDASMGTVTYNRDNKTVVFEGHTFDYIGDMMCSLRG